MFIHPSGPSLSPNITKIKTSGIENTVYFVSLTILQYWHNFDIVTTSGGAVVFEWARIDVIQAKQTIEILRNKAYKDT